MSRRISTKKRFPEQDSKYENLLVSLLVNRILKNGKKRLAKRIVYKAFEYIEFRTNQNPIFLLEKAIRNISPRVQLKAKRVGGATYQVPTLLSKFRSTNIAVRWIVEFSRKRSGKGMSVKLANELLEAAKGLGNAIKKKEETHKMAEANKAFAQFR
jgi:small subunit ribosomal protein S7|uniref:Ribosomal protein S7 n=1 Tax=Synura uvella TaxID=52557 RepID=A0A3G2QZ60_9STRA|nr:ribosomal protein S7 [Synura uvella]AYO28406.1 ribosomal protein S7 [Synura uvella]